MSFGPHFLYRLPHLQSAHIYPMPAGAKPDHPDFLFDNTYDSVEEELCNLVIPWNRYCSWAPPGEEVSYITFEPAAN